MCFACLKLILIIILLFPAHSCTFPGCGSVLVLDGNMKNQRDVCYAKDPGIIQFDGLPGSIKTGCPATPAFKCRYCIQHKNQACELVNLEVFDEELSVTTGPTLRARNTKQSLGNPVAEVILAKKTTRRQTYFQVLTISSMCTYTCANVSSMHTFYYEMCRSCGLDFLNAMLPGNQPNLYHRVWWTDLKLE